MTSDAVPRVPGHGKITTARSEATTPPQKGAMTGTAKQQPDELARIATEDVYTVLNGGKIDHPWLTRVPVLYVDAKNVDKYIE